MSDSRGGQGTRSDRSVIVYLSFLGVLLATGIDIALPAFDAIEDGFESSSNVSLIITLYVIGMALGQLIVGPVADRFGRKPAVLGGLALYAVGAIASALAPSFGLLLIARLVWGLGAAAPAGLRSAITRDLYSGDKMARITTIMMAVFLLGPIFVPLLGDLMIRVAPWPVIFWFAAGLAVVGAIWCVRFGETLAEENQRPLEPRQIWVGVKAVVRTRVTFGHMLANVFLTGAFFIFLGSSQPVFDQVFDRASQFAVFFALAGVFTVPPLILNNRLIKRYGARRMSMLACSASAAIAVAAVVPTLVLDGRPSFWLWYVWVLFVTSLLTLATPSITALALEPMGALAGTASSLLFFSGFAFGAVLAALFDRLVDDTVTPFVVGFALYTSIGLMFMWWAGGGAALSSESD
jgi:DHA1 family bicyclomycin/chloramphenicol resistance-like MFS transporter